ncbi:MAG: hypothetical protein ACRDSP_19395 [Pseudonocardiaceae bacterium]
MSSLSNLDNIRLLGDNADVIVVSDDARLCEELVELGLPTVPWTPDLTVKDGITVVLALCHRLVSRAVRRQFCKAAVLVLPIASFDNSFESIRYTMELAFATDYADTCRRNREWIQLLTDKADPIVRFRGSSTDLQCRVHDDIRAHTSLELGITPGEWVSIADYCEVSITAPSQADWCGAFTIDGYADAVGVLVAEDSRVTPIGHERIEAAKELRAEFVEKGPVRLELQEGVLCSVVVDGRERLREVSEVTNPEYGLHTLELGLGTNPGISPLVDWNINSQLNEGVEKIHLGFGEGITGAHMDFIVGDVKVG